jgi:hypothetical protein
MALFAAFANSRNIAHRGPLALPVWVFALNLYNFKITLLAKQVLIIKTVCTLYNLLTLGPGGTRYFFPENIFYRGSHNTL